MQEISRAVSLVALLVSTFALGWVLSKDKRMPCSCEPRVKVEVDTIQLARFYQFDTLDDWQVLQMAIAFTESRFDPDAVGKAHDSGILQLTPIYVAEVNRVAGTDYTIQDAFDIEKALEIFETMQAVKNPTKDIETAIRYHNKAGYYRSTVLRNMTFIRNYEAVRAAVKK